MGAYYRKDLKKWCISYTEGGRRQREVVGTKAEAMKRLSSKSSSSCPLRLHQQIKNTIAIAEAAQPETTVSSYINSAKWLTELMPDVKLDQVDMEMVRAYQSSRIASGVSGASVNREVALLSKVLSQAVQDGFIRQNQLHGIRNLSLPEPSGKIRYLREDEIECLILNCHGDLKRIVTLAIHSGLRMREIFSLTWSKLDDQEGVVLVWRKHKSHFSAVPLSEMALDQIMRQPKTSTFVFPGKNGEKRTSCRTAFSNAVQRAGLEGVTFHTLRHTFASHAVMAGMDLRTLQELLGHSKLDMVMRYAHLSDDHKRTALSRLESRLVTKPVTESSHMHAEK